MNDSSKNMDIALLAVIAVGVMILMGFNHREAIAADNTFDPSAYLVVLTLIVGAIKERWTQRSTDKMGEHLALSVPTPEPTAVPKDAKEAAKQVADVAEAEAAAIGDKQ